MAFAEYTETVRLVKENCFKCQIIFAIPYDLYVQCNNEGKEMWCPNGHRQYYVKSENQKLKDQLIKKDHQLEQEQAESRQQKQWKNHYKQSAITYKGHLTKVKKRIQHGVCPCCNRQFVNLKTHMEQKHPNYSKKK